eukprot:GSChrysophyteH1.ASY1.ANO1.1824.1 assembled CDS
MTEPAGKDSSKTLGAKSKFQAKDIIQGGILQTCEALTVGMPFEVWKTHMGANRSEGTLQAFRSIYKSDGVGAFWRGWQPKVVESFSKGAVLLFSKEAIKRSCLSFGLGEVPSGILSGFGGGLCQVSVMGPCTFLVTASVAGAQAEGGKMSTINRIKHTYANAGIGGFYRGGTALMLRQGSNWASRQGFTDMVRSVLRERNRAKEGTGAQTSSGQLTIMEEALAGTVGGLLSTWNQPVEVMRIDAQHRAAKGLPPRSLVATAKVILKENGVRGMFQGIVPRMGLCVAQTLYMVTIPYILKSL